MSPFIRFTRKKLTTGDADAPAALATSKRVMSAKNRVFVKRGQGNDPIGELRPRVAIPVAFPSPEQELEQSIVTRGLELARQDDWERLSTMIREADRARERTPAGRSVAALLAEGARADIVALGQGGWADERAMKAMEDGIAALEENLEEAPDDPAIAAIVALAHVDIAWLVRGEGTLEDLRVDDHAFVLHHFDRAREILEGFDPAGHDMPLLSAARAAALAGLEGADIDIRAIFDTWIALDPGDPQAFRSCGNYLLPRWFGSYDELEREARRLAGATSGSWGVGAYVWTYLDALRVDLRAFERLDAEMFLEGIDDILSRLADQHVVNTFVAFLAMVARSSAAPFGDRDRIDDVRARLAAGLRPLIQKHLREIHPLCWTDTLDRRDMPAAIDATGLARLGRIAALSAIVKSFRAELDSGWRLTFTPVGMELARARETVTGG